MKSLEKFTVWTWKRTVLEANHYVCSQVSVPFVSSHQCCKGLNRNLAGQVFKVLLKLLHRSHLSKRDLSLRPGFRYLFLFDTLVPQNFKCLIKPKLIHQQSDLTLC